jgi:hypothetical protein
LSLTLLLNKEEIIGEKKIVDYKWTRRFNKNVITLSNNFIKKYGHFLKTYSGR